MMLSRRLRKLNSRSWKERLRKYRTRKIKRGLSKLREIEKRRNERKEGSMGAEIPGMVIVIEDIEITLMMAIEIEDRMIEFKEIDGVDLATVTKEEEMITINIQKIEILEARIRQRDQEMTRETNLETIGEIVREDTETETITNRPRIERVTENLEKRIKVNQKVQRIPKNKA